MSRKCPQCKKKLRRRLKEQKGNFKKRVFCDNSCAGASNAVRKSGRVTINTLNRMNLILNAFKDEFDIRDLRVLLKCADYTCREVVYNLADKKRVTINRKAKGRGKLMKFLVIDDELLTNDDYFIIKRRNYGNKHRDLSYTDRMKVLIKFYISTVNRELQSIKR